MLLSVHHFNVNNTCTIFRRKVQFSSYFSREFYLLCNFQNEDDPTRGCLIGHKRSAFVLS